MMAAEMDPAQEFEAKLLLCNKAMHEATKPGDSVVQQFYKGAVVFVTGGSGFLGKQLIEKLIRATEVSKVFMLLRAKKGKQIQQRLNEIVQEPVFDLVREQQPNFAEKIVAIEGDIAELRLGISDKDWNTVTEQVDIIYHMAATTRFDESLRVATMINVRGTREALILGKDCKKLKSFVYVSTAYSHACEDIIKEELLEKFYKSPVEPEVMIKLAETVEEQRLNNITPGLSKNWPNTYSFAKAIAEELVDKMSGDLPLCVVRPGIVVSAKREPNPGWIDISNVYGASGIILGPGLGLVHIALADIDSGLGLVPVDFVNNAIITAAWETAKRRAEGDDKIKIYSVTASKRNPTAWKGLLKTSKQVICKQYPSPSAVWWQFGWMTRNPTLFWLCTLILHTIPAYAIDGICFVLGQERRFVKLYKKIYRMSTALSYFTLNDWNFDDRNTVALYNNLSMTDREIFEFNVDIIDWEEFMITWAIGLRKYIIKDGLKGTAYAKKKQVVFKILTFLVAPIYFYLLYKVFSLSILILSLFFRLFW